LALYSPGSKITSNLYFHFSKLLHNQKEINCLEIDPSAAQDDFSIRIDHAG
jgi:hypothetical protein